ncbi:FUSC family protein [Periweissella cryptocerci]|uniref:FUSC family protein n=1 Tax=Periweissella cryptocerci TaxID=2506420 RepID=UPI001FAAFCFD|nr:FUSC family protein [Periweissella cryptocerci]
MSCGAVLAGEEVDRIKKRYIYRIIGSVVGLLIGLILLELHLPMVALIVILMFLNICVEYFMPRNYAIANFFTNPQVLLLATLTTHFTFGLILSRFWGIIIGSILAFFLYALANHAMNVLNQEYK